MEVGELNRTQRILLKNTLYGTELRLSSSNLSDAPNVGGKIPILHKEQIDKPKTCLRVADPEIEAIKRSNQVFAEGEENLRDFQKAIHKSETIPCPDVDVVSDSRYDRMYPPVYGSQEDTDPETFGIELIRTIGDVSDSDGETENTPGNPVDSDYDIDEDDEAFLEQQKSSNKRFRVTLQLFEQAIARLNRLGLSSIDDPKFLKSKEGYPLASLSQKEFTLIFQYWREKGSKRGPLAWIPTLKTTAVTQGAYKAFEYPLHKYEPRVLRSQKQSISFKQANNLHIRAVRTRTELSDAKNRAEKEVLNAVTKRDHISKKVDGFEEDFQKIKETSEKSKTKTFQKLSPRILRPSSVPHLNQINEPGSSKRPKSATLLRDKNSNSENIQLPSPDICEVIFVCKKQRPRLTRYREKLTKILKTPKDIIKSSNKWLKKHPKVIRNGCVFNEKGDCVLGSEKHKPVKSNSSLILKQFDPYVALNRIVPNDRTGSSKSAKKSLGLSPCYVRLDRDEIHKYLRNR